MFECVAFEVIFPCFLTFVECYFFVICFFFSLLLFFFFFFFKGLLLQFFGWLY